ncbi:unnamed protein product, partial [Didymodactylos carnosus]
MDIVGMVTRLPTLVFGASRCDDSFADRLSYKYTVLMLVVFAIIVTNKQFGTKHIQCWVPAQFTKNYEDYVNDICWVSNTYYIPLDEKVPKIDSVRRQNELVCTFLIPFCFYFPHLVWRSLSRRSGIDVRDIIDAAINYKSVDTATKDDNHKTELMEYIVEAIDKYVDDPRRQPDERGTKISIKRLFMTICIFLGKYLGNYLIIVYFTTKALYITNAVCQIFLLNLFLGQKFHLFGIQVVKRIIEGKGWDTKSIYFPKVTLCDFQIREALHPRDSHRYTVQCVLPLNLFSQQSIFDVIVWVTRFFPDKQYNYIKRRLQLMKRDTDFNQQPPEYVQGWYKEFIFGYLEPDGIFMLRLLSSNTSDFVCTEVINQLWQAYYHKDIKEISRKRRRELGGDVYVPPVQRQVSEPPDLTESYDTIRRRANYPSPSPISNGGMPLFSSSKNAGTSSYKNLLQRKRIDVCNYNNLHVKVQNKFVLPSTLPPSFLADTTLPGAVGNAFSMSRDNAVLTGMSMPSLISGVPVAKTFLPSIQTINAPTSSSTIAAPLTITGFPIYRAAVPPYTHSTGNLLKSGIPSPMLPPLTPPLRSKYLQQFHALVDITKTNGFMSASQAKTILQQTGLPQPVLHQIWTLADYDKDGKLTSDEFIIAMHACEVAKMGIQLPPRLPDEWCTQQQERKLSFGNTSGPKSNGSLFSSLNQELKDVFKTTDTTKRRAETTANDSVATATVDSTGSPAADRRNSVTSYEDKRRMNYEDGNKELERRRQMLKEIEEREQREREERERLREEKLQKQKDEQDRKKQMDLEKQLERQRQIEQQREEERKKLIEQRETARKEMERQRRLEWERQRMQELLTQKSRLTEQINDMKSREKGIELELQSMDDKIETCQNKIQQTNNSIHNIDDVIANIQKNSATQKSELEMLEQETKDLISRLATTQSEKEALESSLKQLNQSKEFGGTNRESDLVQVVKSQIENFKTENVRIDEQIATTSATCQEFQNQMEQLRTKLNQLENEARTKVKKDDTTKVVSPVSTTSSPNYDVFYSASSATNKQNSFEIENKTPTSLSTFDAIEIDPFQTVDPFSSNTIDQQLHQTQENNTDWFQQPHTAAIQDSLSEVTNDPFSAKYIPDSGSLPTTDPFSSQVVEAPLKTTSKKAAPKVSIKEKDRQSQQQFDPWGSSSTKQNNGFDNVGNNWTPFNPPENNGSPTTGWPQQTQTDTWANTGTSSKTNLIKYRAIFNYVSDREDELSISVDDEIWV